MNGGGLRGRGGGAGILDSLNQPDYRKNERYANQREQPCRGKSQCGRMTDDSGGGHDVDAYVSKTMIAKRSIDRANSNVDASEISIALRQNAPAE